ncbi:hypothetical protein [Mesorhizobium captivum]|uniref:hypothetical protein n=1 Tax=Mesorhizobium captivum TaxID=3072319 RepID=UPI002A23CA25|nr:hypothetical protein [Mesorhizobium sp. VK3C]MDX8450184.1 hypothetical protein [Mesorhizobium sp. VK3C]
MAEARPSIMQKAEARFADMQKKTAERNKATADYLSEAKLRIIKTAKLRELRLAKEEADRVAEALNATPKKKRATRAVKRPTTAEVQS